MNTVPAMILPILVITIGLAASLLGIFSMNGLKSVDPAWALRLAPIVGILALFAGSYFAVDAMAFGETLIINGPFYAMVVGSLVGLFVGFAGVLHCW